MTIIKQLNNVSHNRWYWLVLVIGGIFLLADALYYQYVNNDLPCTLCIHVRLWVVLFIIVSIVGLLSRNSKVVNALSQLSTVLISVALIDRSYNLLGVERGFLPGTCSFELGLPAWFAVEDWVPWLFRVETTCGKTPEIIFGITMAESLMALSIMLLIASFSILLASLITIIRK